MPARGSVPGRSAWRRSGLPRLEPLVLCAMGEVGAPGNGQCVAGGCLQALGFHGSRLASASLFLTVGLRAFKEIVW